MILVTGGTGLVGAHLLLHLTENEGHIRSIYRTPDSIEKTKSLFRLYQKENFFSKIEWIQGDVTDIPSLENAFENIDYVYHCAGLISYDPNDEYLLRKTNIEGTANIVNFCIDYNVKKLCHVSSIAALGDLAPHEKQITEETEWNPEASHSDYAISKYGAEMEVWRGQQEGLNVIIVNPGVIFGAGFWNQGSGLFFSKVKNGFSFYTNGKAGFVSVTDVAKIMIRLMNSKSAGERFTLIAENSGFKDVIFNIAKKLNVKKPPIEARPWMLGIAWRLDWLKSAVFRSSRELSKNSSRSLLNQDIYSNRKIKDELNYEFQNVASVIDEIISLQKHSS
ncbi:MAG: NAD-dependent epimerase/dehydratase family protein [Flavobacterium sp.]